MLVEFEQNHMVLTTRNFELIDKKKTRFYSHFWQIVDDILENISAAEIIV